MDICGPEINLNSGGTPGTPVGTLVPGVLKALTNKGSSQKNGNAPNNFTSPNPPQNPSVASPDNALTPSDSGPKLKPVIRLSDAPGINGLKQSARDWQVVAADSYLQAITTDDVLMNGQSDSAGNVFSSEEQQDKLAELAQQNPSRLWLITGHRAHHLEFNMIASSADDETKDACAQDTMGFHLFINSVPGYAYPGENLKQCIQSEQAISGSMLEPLREGK